MLIKDRSKTLEEIEDTVERLKEVEVRQERKMNKFNMRWSIEIPEAKRISLIERQGKLP